LWRGEAYMKFFNFLDEQGGFYYEVCLELHRYAFCSLLIRINLLLALG
jgi:hypothetical protein